MKRFNLRFFTFMLLFSFIVVFTAGYACAQGNKLVVKLENKTDAPVFVAIAEMSTGGDSSFDSSKGWWRIDPGQARDVVVGDFGGPMYEYFYYANSMGGKRVWHGKSGDQTFWIHPTKSFNVHPSKNLPGGKKVVFRHFGVNSNGKAKLTFTVK